MIVNQTWMKCRLSDWNQWLQPECAQVCKTELSHKSSILSKWEMTLLNLKIHIFHNFYPKHTNAHLQLYVSSLIFVTRLLNLNLTQTSHRRRVKILKCVIASTHKKRHYRKHDRITNNNFLSSHESTGDVKRNLCVSDATEIMTCQDAFKTTYRSYTMS